MSDHEGYYRNRSLDIINHAMTSSFGCGPTNADLKMIEFVKRKFLDYYNDPSISECKSVEGFVSLLESQRKLMRESVPQRRIPSWMNRAISIIEDYLEEEHETRQASYLEWE